MSDDPNPQAMIGHVSLGVNDLPRALVFYDAVFRPLNFVRVWENAGGVGFAEPGGKERFALFSRPGQVVVPGAGFPRRLRRAEPGGGRCVPCRGACGRRQGHGAAGPQARLRADLLRRFRHRSRRLQDRSLPPLIPQRKRAPSNTLGAPVPYDFRSRLT